MCCDKRNCKPPDNAERSPDHTASAHPYSSRHTTENRFCDISQKSTDHKQHHDLIKAAPFCKYLFFVLFPDFLFNFSCLWICFFQTLFQTSGNLSRNFCADLIHPGIRCNPALRLLTLSGKKHKGTKDIHKKYTDQCQQHNMHQKLRQNM